jgi:hypothetical protein
MDLIEETMNENRKRKIPPWLSCIEEQDGCDGCGESTNVNQE